MMRPETKKITVTAMLVALAMILSYVESLIPPFVAIPGIKLGLANICTVFMLYFVGVRSAALVSFVRVVLSSLLFGTVVSLAYSLAGAFLSLVIMALLSRIRVFSPMGVSAVGGVAHNVGQIIAAALIMENAGIVYYLAPLVISGVLTGAVIGLVSGIIVEKIKSSAGAEI